MDDTFDGSEDDVAILAASVNAGRLANFPMALSGDDIEGVYRSVVEVRGGSAYHTGDGDAVALSERYDVEVLRERLEAENGPLLAEFERSLVTEGLAPKTVRRHVGNAGLYLDYLLHYEPVPAADGWARVDDFLGFFFIRKCWATRGAISESAASVKRFYRFMAGTGRISQEDHDDLSDGIREGKPDWIAAAEAYDEHCSGPDASEPFEWM